MAIVPQRIIDDIMEKLSVEEVVSHYVPLRRRSGRMIGLCPFHKEKTPSFTVDIDQGLYYCFGCQSGGNLFQFIMQLEGLSFVRSVKYLADLAGVDFELEEGEPQERGKRERCLEILERAKGFYHELLLSGQSAQKAREYCACRRLTKDAVTNFSLGYAPQGGQALKSKIIGAGYSIDDGVDAGIMRFRGSDGVDLFQHRLTFPIHDVQGRVVAFGGRVLDQDQEPKYLNSPESVTYSKKKVLFGLWQHRQSIRRAGRAVLVEGYLDVIALASHGFPLAVAPLGTAFTPEQAKLLSRYTDTVLIAFDGDAAGYKATLKARTVCDQAGLKAKIIDFPPGSDPDQFIQEAGPEAFDVLLDTAVPVMDFVLDTAALKYDLASSDGKRDYLEEVLPVLQNMQDGLSQNAYVVQLARRLHLSEEKLTWQLQFIGEKGKKSRWNSTEEEDLVPKESSREAFMVMDGEAQLFYYLLQKPESLEHIFHRWEGLTYLRNDKQNQALEELLEGRTQDWNTESIRRHLEKYFEPAAVARLTLGDFPELNEDDFEVLLRDLRRSWTRERLDRLRGVVLEKIEAGESPQDDAELREYFHLQQVLKGMKHG